MLGNTKIIVLWICDYLKSKKVDEEIINHIKEVCDIHPKESHSSMEEKP